MEGNNPHTGRQKETCVQKCKCKMSNQEGMLHIFVFMP